MADPIVLRVESPIMHPAPAKPGEFLVIYPDRVHVVRPVPNNQGGWLSQWMQGALMPVSEADAERLRSLLHPLPDPTPVTPLRPRRVRKLG